MTMPDGRPFTGMALDRATSERSDPDRIRQWLGDPAARAVAAGEDGVLVSSDSSLKRIPPATRDEPILLGLEHGRPLFAVELDAVPEEERSDGRVLSLREAGAVLSHAEGGLAAYLAALLNWHRRHRFCANCAAATAITEAGHSRTCPQCGAIHFPRTDPVVIMTIEHEARLLLGRRAGWPEGRFSVLAGFVAPGESAEEAVVREAREESGILARDPEYVTSQPWPFPSSLMLGFHARSDGGDPRPGDGELEEVHWYPHDAVSDAVNDRNPELLLPPRISIARFLIERWVARED
jgi:NAD+ diphosphatase